jgi:hypothetical protein
VNVSPVRVCGEADYENSLLNVMPRLQPFFLLLPDRQPDVIAFAHLLFEVRLLEFEFLSF